MSKVSRQKDLKTKRSNASGCVKSVNDSAGSTFWLAMKKCSTFIVRSILIEPFKRLPKVADVKSSSWKLSQNVIKPLTETRFRAF